MKQLEGKKHNFFLKKSKAKKKTKKNTWISLFSLYKHLQTKDTIFRHQVWTDRLMFYGHSKVPWCKAVLVDIVIHLKHLCIRMVPCNLDQNINKSTGVIVPNTLPIIIVSLFLFVWFFFFLFFFSSAFFVMVIETRNGGPWI